MFRKILIANRGEIAIRVIRACKELGIKTVAIYSQADKDSLHKEFADEAICVGPPPPRDSYLNIPNILSAAIVTGAEAIHPCYGFLAENATFARLCEECGIKFIGPSPEVIEALGDKMNARKIMKRAGVPVVPGTEEPVNEEDALRYAEEIGFPLMLKAAAGGGGKGMRMIGRKEELHLYLQSARAEAEAAFGDGRLYLEKFLLKPRHIEVQILADNYGNVVHLGERECSIQTPSYQKMLEEAPSPIVDQEMRQKMGEAAIRAVQAVGYKTAGTVEFLVDDALSFYFMEINTRIQVEHPVTEMITDIDIVKWQILTAAGEKLPFVQEDIKFRGHSIECRITAEDPYRNFAPSVGTIQRLVLPGGPWVRLDTHLYEGYTISPNYDALLAKLIVWAKTREEAIKRMQRALEEFIIEGVKTNIDFHKEILTSAQFRDGKVYVGFVKELLERRSEDEQRHMGSL
ncbi:acetyl-CoA carboxylase biotin carboxylase subunit [bacterium]|nr:acetyl-CoA carboxylase biotin carboxylase subunit [bacterium]